MLVWKYGPKCRVYVNVGLYKKVESSLCRYCGLTKQDYSAFSSKA